jgi:Circadian oscillating protein COP23
MNKQILMNKPTLKSLSLLTVVAAVTCMGASVVLNPQPGLAQTAKYFCDTSGQNPRTMARTPRGLVTIVNWARTVGEYNPLTRCQEVSTRFQNLHQDGVLRFITSGRLNGENIICVAAERNGPCIKDKGLLFTLKPGASPSATIKQMVRISQDATGTGFVQESSNARIYVSIDELLNGTPEASNR